MRYSSKAINDRKSSIRYIAHLGVRYESETEMFRNAFARVWSRIPPRCFTGS
jgi:hypothetical protein